jgi:4-amino-4-deoxychorismate lyase
VKPRIALVDGVACATIDVLDRGLHYGDGLFETLAYRAGRPRRLDAHLTRLARGLERLGIAGLDTHALRADIATAARAAPDLILKVIVTRGSALARGYGTTGRETPVRLVLCWDWSPADDACRARGARIGFAAHGLGDVPVLAGLKHLNRLENVLARREADARGLDEVLMSGGDGRIVCGSTGNVFAVRGEELLTPRVDRAGIAGVTRAAVLRLAPGLGLGVREADLAREEILAADELILTNSRWGAWSVAACEHRPAPRAHVGVRIVRALEADDA